MITLDQDMCIEHGSRGLWALLGYEKKDACNQNPGLYMEHIYLEDVNKYRTYLKDNRSVLDMSACEYRLVTKDGTVIDVLDTMEVVEDAKGLKHGYATVRDITDRLYAKRDIERAKNAEKMQEEEMREILKFGGILSFKYNFRERYCPEYENLEEVMHYTPETYWKTLEAFKNQMDLKGKYVGNLYYFVHEEDRARMQAATDRLLKFGKIETELRFFCGDGAYHWFKVQMFVSPIDTNIVNGYFYNIDDREEEFDRLRKMLHSEREDILQLYRLLDFAGILYFEYNVKENSYPKFSNIQSVMGYTPESYRQTLSNLIDPDDEYGKILGNLYYFILEEDRKIAWRSAETLRRAGEIRTELRFLCGDGAYHWFKVEMDVVEEGEKIIGYMCNVDSKIREIQALQRQVVIDPMTGVYNKVAAFQMFDRYIADHPGNRHALLVVDVDDFKEINDTLGHSTGDQVLIELSSILKRIFRKEDIIGRFGGDEFIVFVKNISSKECVLERAKLLQSLCRACACLKDTGLVLKVSIGVAFSKKDMTGAELFKRADKRLYDVKKMQKGSILSES